MDPLTEDGRLTLTSYVWPDQSERLGVLRRALDVAGEVPAPVDEANADEWLAERLPGLTGETVSVVFHSVVWQYLSSAEQGHMLDHLIELGRRATPDAALAWLRMEPGERMMDVRLTLWPAGVERLLGRSGAHGRPVEWIA